MDQQLDIFHSPAPPARESQLLPRPPLVLSKEGLALRCWPHWATDADDLLERLSQEVPWKQDTITLYGRTHSLPRLTCWVGDPGCSYTYSGVRNPIEVWSPLLQHLRERVECAVGWGFNSLLLNRYRDGRDKLDWHADDERELDPEAPIASLSLGAERSFRLRPRDPEAITEAPLSVELGHGDLLVMDPPTQRLWLHQVPKRLRVQRERINLTFRSIRPEALNHV
ncbi:MULTISPECIES: alpha-ketoglutarate-dependent dioxygenase AlkB [unclassified Synechococcus]|uniref:alpha-ketoglutarate-dependent dioxygenase AlkB family protein n=1 Tax=unclassified Synechococcus TaxID=2626047 RepID=UPI0021A5D6B4|nr:MULTISPECIES: alpha-ketoglutarate-dependent dioxygenase AlkB [unclassified Synechococcus]MCT0212426.1 alpha-ketoglutarate-dependent dioxygenase AlkB [Synechococcus sp. CS-1326]MCT0234609.1 alpha-ketoglutarate-dependent dioxygenase AlkB [Synechococcus sp. CS-1327]